jgi:hypothetical protein
MKYLYNIGCSFSEGNGIGEDRGMLNCKSPNWDEIRALEAKLRYSAVLSEKLGLKEINEAGGGGSNQRIFRKTWNWIAENLELLSETIFVIQWTYPSRSEYWKKTTDTPSTPRAAGTWHHQDLQLEMEQRLKMFREEPEVAKKWDEKGLWPQPSWPSPNSASNVTLRYILSLQSFFKQNNIKFIFFEGDDLSGANVNFTSNLGKLVDLDYWILESFVRYSGKELTLNNHPNKKMQILWSEKLEKFIKDKNWLS